MKKIKRMAIFSHATPDHVNWVVGLKQGMKANGVDVVTSWPLPNGPILDRIIENYRPDVVFEINRHKDQVPETSNSFFHVCLIHEHRSHDTVYTETSGNSDFYYSITKPSGYDFPKHLDERARVFIPGFNTDVLSRVTPQPKRYDLGFAGFMGDPKAYSSEFVGQLIDNSKPEFGTIKDLVRFIGITKTLINENDSIFRIRRKIEAYFHQLGHHDFKFIDHADKLIFRMCEDGFLRISNRKHLCDLMLKTSDNLAFWGSPLWTLWPQYSPFYKSELKSTLTLLEAYSSLKINIHCTGTNLHPRVVDTMAMGMPIAVVRHESDSGPFGMDQFFEPDVHYIRVNFDNFKDKLRYYLENKEARDLIGKQAKRRVMESFTWKERCRLILEDLESVV